MDQKLKSKLRKREYRAEFAEAYLDDSIALQIRTLREMSGLSQEELGKRAGMKQHAISRIEAADYGAWTVSTLKRIARALDLPLAIRFESWGDLLRNAVTFTPEALSVPAIEDDPVFTAIEGHGIEQLTGPNAPTMFFSTLAPVATDLWPQTLFTGIYSTAAGSGSDAEAYQSFMLGTQKRVLIPTAERRIGSAAA